MGHASLPLEPVGPRTVLLLGVLEEVVMTCTWVHVDGHVCGKPAHAFRVQWFPQKQTWYFCKRHLAALAPDEVAKRDGVETYYDIPAAA